MNAFPQYEILVYFNPSTSFKANGAPRSKSCFLERPRRGRRSASSEVNYPQIGESLKKSSDENQMSSPSDKSLDVRETEPDNEIRGEGVAPGNLLAANSAPEEKQQKCVKLQMEPQLLGEGDNPIGCDDFITNIECRPFAILLRFRVVQIVCGIVTILLGVVSVFEPGTRSTLGLGIPSGLLTVMSAVARIQAAQKFTSSRRRLSSTYPLAPFIPSPSGSDGSRPPSCWRKKLAPLHPLTPTFACLISASLLLSLASNAMTSNNHNSFVLGLLLGLSSLVILGVEFTAWGLGYKWIKQFEPGPQYLEHHGAQSQVNQEIE